ncbi:hypothetical protein AAG570_012072 [Ranatra chinensis]|uniref:Metalloendopeptidase n=1 Tax=Ranatra chinensis TaxID=642074 RepID=A0ABD0YHQ7_9HEMI
MYNFGEQLFIQPKSSTGDAVAKWGTSNGGNPEELGEYAEGDILFPPSLKPLAKNGVTTLASRWKSGKVPYILNGSFSSKDRNLIMAAFNEYHRKTCIKFIPRTSERDYVVITSGNTGCWSSVGKIGGAQEVNLQNPGCLSKVGTVIHELMHALGFLHEQNRWERDDYVLIRHENIQSGTEYNFKKMERGTSDGQGINYDYESVMHYSENAFSKNGRPTIIPRVSGVTLGQREGLSYNDVKKIRRMYRCKNKVSHV